MVFHANVTQVREAYQPIIGKANYASHDHTPDAARAVSMAHLQPGERVLDLGCGGGKVLVAAKQAVRDGLVVGVDILQEFLDIDATVHLRTNNLTVAPAGDAAQRVHLVQGSVTTSNLKARIEAKTGQPAAFDAVFLVHVFETIPVSQRRDLLLRLKSLLAPGGRIIMTASARFPCSDTAAPDANVPVLLRTAGEYTEAPGSVIITSMDTTKPVRTADGTVTAKRTPSTLVQTVPNCFWDIAREQACAAAEAVGLHVTESVNIGAHDFGLPHKTSSPSAMALRGMSNADIDSWILQRRQSAQFTGGHHCWGRLLEAKAERTTFQYDKMRAENCDAAVAWAARAFATQMVADVDRQRQQKVASGLALVVPMATHNQLAVMVELRE
jgi:SAM-dependent methyltransferase